MSTTPLAKILAMACNEDQDDSDAHLPRVDYAYNNSAQASLSMKYTSDAYRNPPSPSSIASTEELIRALTAAISHVATLPENGSRVPASSCVNSTPLQLLV